MNINDIIEIFYWLFQHDVEHEIFIKQLTYKIDLHCDQKGLCQKELHDFFRIMHVSRSLDFTDIVPKPSPFTPDTGGQRRKGV